MFYKSIVICVITCFACGSIFGQLAVGTKAETNLSILVVNQSADLRTHANIGFTYGGSFTFRGGEFKALKVDFVVQYKSSEVENMTSQTTFAFQYLGLSMPVYGMLQVDLGKGEIYAGLGPYASYGIISRFCNGQWRFDPYRTGDTTAMMRRWDFGFGMIFGYEWNTGLQVNLDCQVGLRNIMNANPVNAHMFSHMLGLGVGYSF